MFGMTNSGRCRCGSANPWKIWSTSLPGCSAWAAAGITSRNWTSSGLCGTRAMPLFWRPTCPACAGRISTWTWRAIISPSPPSGARPGQRRPATPAAISAGSAAFGRVQRTFDVPEVDTDAITASYRSGVLSLRLPKLHQAEPDVRHVTSSRPAQPNPDKPDPRARLAFLRVHGSMAGDSSGIQSGPCPRAGWRYPIDTAEPRKRGVGHGDTQHHPVPSGREGKYLMLHRVKKAGRRESGQMGGPRRQV